MYKPPSFKTDGIRSIKSETFGEHLTCNHVAVYRDNEASIEGCGLALIIRDVGTSFTHAYPSGRKSQDKCYPALRTLCPTRMRLATRPLFESWSQGKSPALAVLSLAVLELSDLDLALALGAFEAALGLASALGLALAFGFGFALGAGGSGSRVMRS